MDQLELDDEVYNQITTLSQLGDDYFDNGDSEKAIETYNKALTLMPEPVYDWEAATWLFAAIGDAYWDLLDFDKAYDAFYNALKSPGGVGNPFIHLRMGQLQVEFGNIEKARDELIRAYMGGDRDIFEEEDPKYFAVIEDLVEE